MKDLTPLEKEIWCAMNKTKWHPELLQSETWRASIDSIRDVAALCEKKKEALGKAFEEVIRGKEQLLIEQQKSIQSLKSTISELRKYL